VTNHFVNLSGGAGSWYTARRVIELAEPGDFVDLVFADTNMEDEDLYRFLNEAITDLVDRARTAELDVDFTYLEDGRDVWQVFHDSRYLGNSRIDPCSRILKRDLIRSHLEATYDAVDTICYIGIDWSEDHRFQKAKPHWAPYEVRAPLCDPPYIDRAGVLQAMEEAGIAPPRLYAMGFPHNNCGGFCVKAGHGAFKILLEQMPERYAYHERKEQELREYLGKDVAILRDRSGGTVTPLTLTAFRERVGVAPHTIDENDLGGCACFTPDDA
jgi:hypothetical protein